MSQDLMVLGVLDAEDKQALDSIQNKRKLALAEAKAALATNELVELQHQNLILRLSIKYSLKDGDTIMDDGRMVRKTEV